MQSTVLVSDLNLAVVSGNYSKTPAFGVNVTRKRFDTMLLDGRPQFYRRRSEQYPSFAERTLTGASQSSGLYDTGVVIRAFLPFSSPNDRSHIESFNGTAAGLMMRTVCAKPKYDNITLAWGGLGYHEKRIIGTISVDPMIGKQRLLNTAAVGDVDCFLGSGSELYVCEIYGDGLTWPAFDMVYFDTEDPMKRFQARPGEVQGHTYIVWNDTSFSSKATLPDNQTQPRDDSEWVHLEFPLGTSNWKRYTDPDDLYSSANPISGYLTLCVTMTLDQYMNISASRPQIVHEPSIGWVKSVNDSSPDKIDTESVRKQLGVNTENPSLQERGLLSLDSWAHPTYLDTMYFNDIHDWYSWYSSSLKYRWSKYMQRVVVNWTNADDSSEVGGGFDNYLFAILDDTITSTTHPAFMFQAANTLLYSMAYYNEYIAFDLYDNSTRIKYFFQALQPVKKLGYWTVAAIIVCHFILISIIILLYVSGGDNGDILGQALVAVNQLQSEEVVLIRQSSDAVIDGDVKRMLKENGLAHRKVGLVDHGGHGHVIRSLRE